MKAFSKRLVIAVLLVAGIAGASAAITLVTGYPQVQACAGSQDC